LSARLKAIMSKAFTREDDDAPEVPEFIPPASTLEPGAKNYITLEGAQKLRDELQRLVEVTRPELADARGDPDAKRQLARLDQRIVQLEESLQSAEIVPAPSGPADVVRFGATVSVRESDGTETSYRIVGGHGSQLGELDVADRQSAFEWETGRAHSLQISFR
jgi:transcription elongation factor GreB